MSAQDTAAPHKWGPVVGKVVANRARGDRINARASHPRRFRNGNIHEGGPVNKEDREADPNEERGNWVSSEKGRDSQTSPRTHRPPNRMDAR